MTIKINETGEVKTLEMIDRETGTDNVRDFIGNSGGLGASGQFASVDGEGYQFTVSQADYDWWAKVIGDHSALDARIASLIEEHGRADVMDALEGAYDCDLEDQAGLANRNLDESFGRDLPASVLARWDAADWDDEWMKASHYRYETEDGPIDLTEAEAALYTWGQTEDNITGGCQRGDLR